MRRIALISDIHGNDLALDAVLADIETRGFTETYCLGDLVGYGPEPEAVVSRIRDAGIATIRGNYDEGVGTRRGDCGCYYATAEAREDGDASYAFTDAALSDDAHAWLAALPERIELAEAGLRILLVHGSPRKINEYLMPDRTDEQLARLALEAGADVVCHGHVHLPFQRRIEAGERVVQYVSVGSVGKPKDGDLRASWTELVIDADAGLEAVVHRMPYDARAVADAMVAKGLPERLARALIQTTV